MGRPLLELHDLTKRYPGTAALALDHISLSVAAGEVYGFLGSNGAGKSTTIRLILNFILPTSGTATIAGLDSVRRSVAAKRFVGYLAGEVALYGRATAQELLRYLAALQPPKHPAYVKELSSRFDVPLHQPISTLSKGNRQKLGIVQAFMHEPDLLVLDEPTSGLDPLMQETFFQLVDEARQRGAAIFLSSHNLAEVQRICDRVGILKHGRLIQEQPVSQLAAANGQVFKVRLVSAARVPALCREPSLEVVGTPDGASVTVRPKASLAGALAALSRYDIASLSTEQTDLEEAFMQYYGDES